MEVTATEFKTNLGKYLDLVATENIWITRNGKTVAKLTNANVSSVDLLSGVLAGKADPDTDSRTLREERLNRYAMDD